MSIDAATTFREVGAAAPPAPPRRIGWGWIAGALALAAAATSCVFVDETELVLIERLGVIRAVYDRVDPVHGDRGLHFKLPWPIETVRRFDRRLQLFDARGREMFTRDKKNITIDPYICWRIAPGPAEQGNLADRPVVRFFRGLGTIPTAESRLDVRLRSILASEMGQVELSELLHVADSTSGPDGASRLEGVSAAVLEQMRRRPDEAEALADRLGVEIVDCGVQRINLPEANLVAVYERMRKEREKIAQSYRSAGEARKVVIESAARRHSAELLARAGADAERIRGAGDAEALALGNQAYARDPEFYARWRALESYQKILNERTTLVLSASSGFLKLLTDGLPPAPAPAGAKPVTLVPPADPAAVAPPAPAPATGGGP